MDFYAALGVAPDASTEEIERAYRAVARRAHPDLDVDNPIATARMKQLNEIRETLTDPLLRAGYDDRLRLERQNRSGDAQPRNASGQRPATPNGSSHAGSGTSSSFDDQQVASVLRNSVIRPAPRKARPIFILLALAGAAAGGAALLWPQQPAARPPIVAASFAPEKREGVTVVRGTTGDLRRAIRKTGSVVAMGATFDELIRRFGPPDRVDPVLTKRDVTLVYGRVRVALHDGRVVSASP